MQQLTIAVALMSGLLAPDRSAKLSQAYVDAVAKINSDHLARPKAKTESELGSRLPKKALRALEQLVDLKEGKELVDSLTACARAAIDLDRIEDFERCRAALSSVDPGAAAALGVVTSRERMLIIGEGGLSDDYVEHFADVAEDILEAYDDLFGFHEFSKVPGKKLRFRVHLEEEIVRPPHFAPQYPWHSEVDFPVIDPEALRSPTSDGKFLFYGLCHELGHVIAMWGDPMNEEDHHAWAHYTGIAIVDHLAAEKEPPQWLKECTDVRWRSIAKEKERLGETEPGTSDRDGVLTLLLTLHEEVGGRGIGSALNALDAKDKRRRVNQVRYYTFAEFEGALRAEIKDKKRRRKLAELFKK